MALVNSPEIVLYNSINTLLKYIVYDYQNTSNKQETYLYYLLSGLKIDKYDWLTQGTEVFIKEIDDPRVINLGWAYNMKLNTPPSIYISLPSETLGEMNIGVDQGYQSDVFTSEGQRLPTYISRYQATYQIVITSDNSNEVVLIYHVLKSALTSMIAHFNYFGMQNITLGGGDLSLGSELLPNNLYYRIINLGCQYESASLSLNKYPVLSQLIFQGNPVESL